MARRCVETPTAFSPAPGVLPQQLPPLPVLRPPPLCRRRGQGRRSPTRLAQTSSGVEPNTSRPNDARAAPQRLSHSHPHLAAGLALPLWGTAIPPPGPRPHRVPELQPRRAPGLRPRGDIRAPGSGSRPHLRAPAAAGEAPNPTLGGGSAERPAARAADRPFLSVRL